MGLQESSSWGEYLCLLDIEMNSRQGGKMDKIGLIKQVQRLTDENEKLKRIIAKELTENDELGCEFVYVSELKRANAELIKALNKIKSGSGRAEVLGLDMYRCPQCAAADIAAEALAKPGVTES